MKKNPSEKNVIFGYNPVLEIIRAGANIQKLLVATGRRDERISRLIREAEKRGVKLLEVDRNELGEISGTTKHQGVLAFVSDFNPAGIEDILAVSKAKSQPAFVSLLDGIEDPHNLGAIIRSADGAGADGIVLPKNRSARITGTVAKTSAGALVHMKVASVTNLARTIDELKDEDIWFVGADQDSEQNYTEIDLTGPIGIVVGAEGKGMHRLIKEKCDFLVKIPMFGKVNSLNASVAAALLFFEVRRQREEK